ncbi:MAG TPA: hypothetical protein VKZ94_07620, partial [Advenella sp.]|nr:hypothetical protein [Advenella sp.]
SAVGSSPAHRQQAASPGRADDPAPVRQREHAVPVHIPPPLTSTQRPPLAQDTPAWQDKADDMPVLMPVQRPAQVPPFGSSEAPRPARPNYPGSQPAASAGTSPGRQPDASRHSSPAAAPPAVHEAQRAHVASTALSPDHGQPPLRADEPYSGAPTATPGTPYRSKPEGGRATADSAAQQHGTAAAAPTTRQSDAASSLPDTPPASSAISGVHKTPASPSSFPGHPTPEDYAPFLNSARDALGHHSKPELYVWSDDENDAFSQAAQADFTLNRIEPTAGRPTFDASLFRAPSRPDALAATVAHAAPRHSDPAADMQAEIDALIPELLDESHEYLKRRLLEEIPEIIAKYRHDR